MSWYLWIIATFIYLNVGFVFGELNLRVLQNSSAPKFIKFVLWPLTEGEEQEEWDNVPINKMGKTTYILLMSIFWPAKIVCNLLLIILNILCTLLSLISSIIIIAAIPAVKIFTWLTRKIIKIDTIDQLSTKKSIKGLFK